MSKPVIYALVVARGGSRGLPQKNIRNLRGKPLIAYTIEAARQSALVDEVYLSTDDMEIASVAKTYGCEIPFLRESSLATDDASSVDVVSDAIKRLAPHDIVVLLQPTSPLRTAQDIDSALELMLQEAAPACVSVCPAADHPWLVQRIDANGNLDPYCSSGEVKYLRRQDLPEAWVLNGAIYAARCDLFIASGSFMMDGTIAYRMPLDRSVDIDTEDDLNRAEQILRALEN